MEESREAKNEEFVFPEEVTDLVNDILQDESINVSISHITSHYTSCESCGKRAAKKCMGCDSVFYCNAKCQHEDWSAHKLECNLIKEKAKWDDERVTEDIMRRHLSRHHHSNIFESVASEVPPLEEFDVEETIREIKALQISSKQKEEEEEEKVGEYEAIGRSGKVGMIRPRNFSNRWRRGRPFRIPYRGRYARGYSYYPRRRNARRARPRYPLYGRGILNRLLTSLMYGYIDPFYFNTYPEYATAVRDYRFRAGLAPYVLPAERNYY